MNLSEKTNASLDEIRTKVQKQDVTWKGPELDHLEQVWSEIIKQSNGKDVVLDRTCSACINRAMQIVYNYISYHEQKPHGKKVKATISEPAGGTTAFVGTLGSGKFTERQAKLNTNGFTINEKAGTFEKSETVNDLTLTASFHVSIVQSMPDEDFDLLLSKVSEPEPDPKTQGLSSDEIVIRIEALFILGFEYQDEAYRNNITGTEIKIDSIKTFSDEEWKGFLNDEETLKQAKAKQVIIPPAGPTKDDSKKATTKADSKPAASPKLDFDKKSGKIVEVISENESIEFTGDISKLDYNKVLWPLARKKGFIGSKPPKAELIEYLS